MAAGAAYLASKKNPTKADEIYAQTLDTQEKEAQQKSDSVQQEVDALAKKKLEQIAIEKAAAAAAAAAAREAAKIASDKEYAQQVQRAAAKAKIVADAEAFYLEHGLDASLPGGTSPYTQQGKYQAWEVNKAAYDEQQGMIERGELVKMEYQSDIGLEEFGIEPQTQIGLIHSAPDRDIGAAKAVGVYQKNVSDVRLQEYIDALHGHYEDLDRFGLPSMSPSDYSAYAKERISLDEYEGQRPLKQTWDSERDTQLMIQDPQMAAEYSDPTLEYSFGGTVSEYEGDFPYALSPVESAKLMEESIDEWLRSHEENVISQDDPETPWLTQEYDRFPTYKAGTTPRKMGGKKAEFYSGTPQNRFYASKFWGLTEVDNLHRRTHTTMESSVGPYGRGLYEKHGLDFPVFTSEYEYYGYDPYITDPARQDNLQFANQGTWGWDYGQGQYPLDIVMTTGHPYDMDEALEFGGKASDFTRPEHHAYIRESFPSWLRPTEDGSWTPKSERHQETGTDYTYLGDHGLFFPNYDDELWEDRTTVAYSAIEGDEEEEFGHVAGGYERQPSDDYKINPYEFDGRFIDEHGIPQGKFSLALTAIGELTAEDEPGLFHAFPGQDTVQQIFQTINRDLREYYPDWLGIPAQSPPPPGGKPSMPNKPDGTPWPNPFDDISDEYYYNEMYPYNPKIFGGLELRKDTAIWRLDHGSLGDSTKMSFKFEDSNQTIPGEIGLTMTVTEPRWASRMSGRLFEGGVDAASLSYNWTRRDLPLLDEVGKLDDFLFNGELDLKNTYSDLFWDIGSILELSPKTVLGPDRIIEYEEKGYTFERGTMGAKGLSVEVPSLWGISDDTYPNLRPEHQWTSADNPDIFSLGGGWDIGRPLDQDSFHDLFFVQPRGQYKKQVKIPLLPVIHGELLSPLDLLLDVEELMASPLTKLTSDLLGHLPKYIPEDDGIDIKFKTAVKELEKEKKLNRLVGSSLETIWNILPNAAMGIAIAPTMSVNQWKDVIEEMDPIGEAKERYQDDPYGFYGDIIGSLVGFTGGVAALSKIPKVGGIAGRTVVRTVQPGEEMASFVGAKLLPDDIIDWMGGKFDWEEASVRLGRDYIIDPIEAKFKKTTKKGIKLERAENILKDLKTIESDKQRSLASSGGVLGFLQHPQSWYLQGHNVKVDTAIKRSLIKEEKLDAFDEINMLKQDYEKKVYLKKSTLSSDLESIDAIEEDMRQLKVNMDKKSYIWKSKKAFEGYELDSWELFAHELDTDFEGAIEGWQIETDREQDVIELMREIETEPYERMREAEYEKEHEGVYEVDIEGEMESKIQQRRLGNEYEGEYEGEYDNEFEFERERLELEIEAEIEAELETELEVEFWFRGKKKRLEDDFGELFPGFRKFEMYSPVKTKIDEDIEEILKL